MSRGFGDERAGLGVGQLVFREVAADAVAQALGLAHVDHAAAGVLVEIHSGREGELGYFVAEFHRGEGYNSIMSRWILVVLAAGLSALYAQDSKPKEDLKKQRPQPAVSEKEEVPPEEDTSLATTEFSFNPLQSKKDVVTGDFYWKKKSYLAAAGRFRDATKWDDSNSERGCGGESGRD